ncbi:M1 family metallopeptidase [Nonomuraea sediminis]|uniref:M1 family metallopeptidase n=1 Tax=Nonomuraea sediminis TaxID=2835864 RepID=UPI001BDD2587|nr:M1 family metallopeptidase [Nonomuraea sediminis]
MAWVSTLAVAVLLSGIGDPYFPADGNAGYDVSHYRLDLRYQPGADRLAGTAVIRASATRDLRRVSFDFRLDASEARVNGVQAGLVRRGGKLVVTPEAALPAGRPFSVEVRYSGVPSRVVIDGERPWKATPDGAYSTAEPHIASAWFPCNDHPRDKATYDVSVTVPDGTQVISTGVLKGTDRHSGSTTWHWHGSRPQASYLQTLAIGHYAIKRGTAPDGRPIVTAYDRRLSKSMRKAAQDSLERTPEVLAWEESLFGPYPFEAEGGIVVAGDDSEDAEEFQTRPVYRSGAADLTTVVHENAHQWFGDSVSVRSWRDIWLNEGFATYAEWMWSEHLGKATARQQAAEAYARTDWRILPGDPGREHLFDDPVYNRGAMTLQALRDTVGDRDFFAIVRAWATRHRYGNGSTPEFVALAEKISGKRLDTLFRTWLFTKGRPHGRMSTFASSRQP